MDEWELDYEWLRVRHVIKDSIGRPDLPNMNNILFLIGIQELGRFGDKFSKEEKQDLMHVAVCTLLEPDGYYKFKGRDADGWPHFDPIKNVPIEGVKTVSYTHLRAHETLRYLVCRLLLEKKK